MIGPRQSVEGGGRIGVDRGRAVFLCLAVQILALLFLVETGGAATISNMWLKESGRGVVVGYDLDAEKPVPVRLVGSKDGGRTYDMQIVSVSGDVGSLVSPGKGKRIVWAVSKDYPQGIDDLDVVLEVIVDRTPARSAEEQARPKGPVYFVIPFRGEVGKEVQRVVIERCLVEAARLKPDAVVLEIDSPGGLIAELYQWEVRSSLDEIDEMAHQYPFIRSRLYAAFKKGTEPLRSQCDDALRQIKDYQLQRSRSLRRR